MPTSGDIASQTREVFHLRKAGMLAEALVLGEALYRTHASDPWVIRAFAWCLYDEMKRLGDTTDAPAHLAAVQQLSRLKIPVEDDLLTQKVTLALRYASPAGRALVEATRMSKAGQHGEAVRAARPHAGAANATRETVVAYGWILYRKIKATEASEGNAPRLWCFDEFSRVWTDEWIAEPMLTKCLLLEGMKNAENWEGFVSFVEGLSLEKLTAKDWADERPEAVDFAPFQHQLLKAIYQNLKRYPLLRRSTPGLHRWFNAWESALCGSDWPDYHQGRILAWTEGDRAKARCLLLKTVQRNPSEFWRWRALADTVEPDQVKTVLARAVVCPCQDATFKTGLYREFAEELAKTGLHREASGSFNEFLRLVRLAGKEFHGSLPTWYQGDDSALKIDLQKVAEDLSQEADELLLEALPEYLGVLICKLPPKEGKKGDVYLYYLDQLGVRPVKFRSGAPPVEAPAILAKIRENPGGLSLAFKWTLAEVPSALGKKVDGIVSSRNLDKGLASVMTRLNPFIPLRFDRWPAARELMLGDCVNLRIIQDEKGKAIILNWRKLPVGSLIPGLSLEFEGEFRSVPGKAFGFIQSNKQSIFVRPEDARGMVDNQFVSGLAIRSEDKHGGDSWFYLKTN